MQPTDFVSGLGQLPDPQRAIDEALTRRFVIQRAQIQQAAQQQEFQQQQAYQQDVEAVMSNPTAEGYSSLFAKHPQFKDAIAKSWDTRDAAAKQGDLSMVGQIHAALRNGKPDLAISTLERRIAADKEAGQDTADDEQLLSTIRSGDVKSAEGLTGAIIASVVGPEKYASVYEQLNKGNDPFTLAPGSKRYDASGKVIAEAPFAPQYRNVGEGDTLVEVGGGDPASSGTSGANALAGNNPGGINDGEFARKQPGYTGPNGRFAGFKTLQDGVNAQKALLRSYIGRGYDTPAKIAARWAPKGDGKNDPTAYAAGIASQLGIGVNDKLTAADIDRFQPAQATQENAAYGRASGGGRVVAQGAPKTKDAYRIMSPQEVASVPGLDPQKAYQVSPQGQITAVGGSDRGQLKPWPAVALLARASNDAALTNIQGAISLFDPKNKSRDAVVARRAIGTGTGMLGDTFTQWNDPNGTDARARIGQIGGILIKDTSGAAVSLSEDARLAKWVPLITDNPQIVIAKLKNLRRELAQRNEAMEGTYSEDQGYRPFKASQPAQGGFRIKRIIPAGQR